MDRNSKKIPSPKMQDIIAGGFFGERERKQSPLYFKQCVAMFMVVAFIFLPAFPALAQFEIGESSVETQGSVALQEDEQVPSAGSFGSTQDGSGQVSSSGEISSVITDVLVESSTSTAVATASSTTSSSPIQDEDVVPVSGSASFDKAQDIPISPPIATTTTTSEGSVGLTHSDGVRGKPEERSKLYTGSTASSTAGFDEEIRRMRRSSSSVPVVDVSKLRDQIRREVEEEFRAKVATGEMQEKIKDEITERIRQGCLEFEDGSYYCIKNNTQALPTSTESLVETPTVFLSKSENGGNRGVFLKEGSTVRQISKGAEDTLFPALDLYGDSIIWQALLDNVWQIVVYDRTTASTTALTYNNFNNMNPQIQKNVIVWQGWVDNNWEIFMAQKEKEISSSTQETWWIKKLTENSWHDMFPRISGDRITWQAYKNGVWQVFMYDIEMGVVSQLSVGSDKSENPRFVIMWEKRDANGGMQTYGYDMTSGESLVIGKHEDKMPFSNDIPQAPLQENQGVIPASSTTQIKNPNENNSGNNGE